MNIYFLLFKISAGIPNHPSMKNFFREQWGKVHRKNIGDEIINRYEMARTSLSIAGSNAIKKTTHTSRVRVDIFSPLHSHLQINLGIIVK